MANDQVFRDLRQEVEDDDGPQVNQMESLCLNCRENGTTRMLFTSIPFFREVVVMSFECLHCRWTNNELQPASRIQEKGITYRVKCINEKDLSRQVVKTEWAEISIPEIDFEITKQSGLITTVEGLIDRATEGLRETVERLQGQVVNDSSGKTAETILKLSGFVSKLLSLKDMSTPFTFILDDPTGNSFVENPLAPEADPNTETSHYVRTLQQDKLIGIVADDYREEDGAGLNTIREELQEDPRQLIKGEVLEFPTNCSSCNAPCFTNMKVTEIPHFKEIIIMATNCNACGHKTREVKSGSGVGEKGVRIVVKVDRPDVLNYEVVKSDTCSVEIPELELELNSSGSGRYTTIEGLAENIKQELKDANPFVGGDSALPEAREKLNTLLERLNDIMGLTIILDDPCGNSYIENADSSEHYERTWQQNEELGINDMKIENY